MGDGCSLEGGGGEGMVCGGATATTGDSCAGWDGGNGGEAAGAGVAALAGTGDGSVGFGFARKSPVRKSQKLMEHPKKAR